MTAQGSAVKVGLKPLPHVDCWLDPLAPVICHRTTTGRGAYEVGITPSALPRAEYSSASFSCSGPATLTLVPIGQTTTMRDDRPSIHVSLIVKPQLTLAVILCYLLRRVPVALPKVLSPFAHSLISLVNKGSSLETTRLKLRITRMPGCILRNTRTDQRHAAGAGRGASPDRKVPDCRPHCDFAYSKRKLRHRRVLEEHSDAQGER